MAYNYEINTVILDNIWGLSIFLRNVQISYNHIKIKCKKISKHKII